MFEKLSNSWELVKASAAVLRADKELLLFPVISAILSILVVVTFAVPAILAGVFASGVEDGVALSATGYAAILLFYVVQYFVIFFCNTALVGAALIRLRGGDPTVADGFRIAASRVGADSGLRVHRRHGGHGAARGLRAERLPGTHRRGAGRLRLEPGHVPRGAGAGG